jgi:hypothetical protein
MRFSFQCYSETIVISGKGQITLRPRSTSIVLQRDRPGERGIDDKPAGCLSGELKIATPCSFYLHNQRLSLAYALPG